MRKSLHRSVVVVDSLLNNLFSVYSRVNDDCRRFRDLRLSKSTKSIYWKRSTDIKSLPSPRYGVDVDVIRDEDKKRLTECYDYKLAVQSSGFQKT